MAFLLSIITPAYNEERNLPVLYERLHDAMARAGIAWEWLVVDDHSTDNTFEVVKTLSQRDPRVRGLRFARNFGAHTASAAGLHHARGDCAAVLASDLQDPPETLAALVERWRTGAQIVWAVRESREGESATTVGFARLYYWIMRNVVGIREMPPTGADFFLADRKVVDAFTRFGESNTSLHALITWMGFRQSSVRYAKDARLHGQSSWTLAKKFKLVVDSVASFSYLPIRVMSLTGALVAVLGFIYAALVLYNALSGSPVEGWSSLMIVVLVLGGFQMAMMGVLGEYLWRTLDEARRRPRYIVEAETAPPEAANEEQRRIA